MGLGSISGRTQDIRLRWNLTMLLISLMDVDEIALSPIGLLA